MVCKTHRQLAGIAILCPDDPLPLPIQQATEALRQGETLDQVMIRLNQQGILAWRQESSSDPLYDSCWVRPADGLQVLIACTWVQVPVH
ncbi:hypothetical protein GIX45_19390 [Erwinia sp. CPCC 100877]|nr:hypothetical protein [Erwinia sp. CPCC 100877]